MPELKVETELMNPSNPMSGYIRAALEEYFDKFIPDHRDEIYHYYKVSKEGVTEGAQQVEVTFKEDFVTRLPMIHRIRCENRLTNWEVAAGETRQKVAKDADDHILQCQAVIRRLQSLPDSAVIIKVRDIEFGVCNNEAVIELLQLEANEAIKAKNGLPNKFE